MPYDPGVIRTALHAHAARSSKEYEQRQFEVLAKYRQRGMTIAPWEAPAGAVVIISGGTYVVVCTCGNAPVAAPEYDEARCLECGAVYHHLTWPPKEAVADIEDALLVRPRQHRHWKPGESVTTIKAENRANGLAESKSARERPVKGGR
jgi:hypothetical protein